MARSADAANPLAVQPRTGTRVRVLDTAVVLRDGTRLAADVAVADDGVPRPTLLVRTPYSRQTARQTIDPIAFARAGWSVVLQDVRGRHDSEGHFDPFHQEQADGAETIRWCARQPWSDGRVALWGASYLGATQMLGASRRPPALRAMAPMVTTGAFDEGWTYEGGALQLGFVLSWAQGFAASDPRSPRAAKTAAARLGRDWERLFRHPLGDHPLRAAFPALDRWLDPSDRRYWGKVDVTRALRRLAVPAFHVAGWYDIFCEGSLRAYAAMSDGADDYAARSQRLIVGPWTHAGVFVPLTAEMDFGIHANGLADNTPGRMIQWLRRAVDGLDVEGGARVFVMGRNRWRELPSWPPPSTATPLYLDEGALQWAPPATAGQDRFAYDPDDPVPTRGGRCLGPYLPLAGPVDQRPVEARGDVLVYTSPRLRRAVEVIGTVTARVVFASSAPSADVTVKLVDCDPSGRAYNVVDSVRRVTLVPGKPTAVDVTVGSTAMCFKAGHRIRVEISSSNFPRLDRNPSTGEPAGTATRLLGADQTVYRGGRRPSYVTLPVVAG